MSSLLAANAIRSLHRHNAHLRHPSIAASSIVEIRLQTLRMVFPGSEFVGVTGEVDQIRLKTLANDVGQACVEATLEDQNQETRHNYFTFDLLHTPHPDDRIEVLTNFTKESAENYLISSLVTTTSGGRKKTIATGTSVLILNPVEIQRPLPLRRPRRRPLQNAAAAAVADAASAPPPPAQQPAAVAPPQPPQPAGPSLDESVIVLDGPLVASPPAPTSSTLLYPYIGNMNEPISQRYMVSNVRASTPTDASSLLNFASQVGFTPTNICHAQMFIKVPRHYTWVYYFDVQSAADRARLEKHLIPERLWFKKFNGIKCIRGEVIWTEAMPMKSLLRLVLTATWVHLTANRAPRFLDRRRAIDSPEALEYALKFERDKRILDKALDEDGKAMLLKIVEDSENGR